MFALNKPAAPLLVGLHKGVVSVSETVIVALITFSSGIIGAISGAFVSLKLDKSDSKRQIRKEKQACYAQLVSAYDVLMRAISVEPNLTDGLPPKGEQELYTQFQIAHTNALLICDKPSVAPITELFNQVTDLHLRRAVPSDVHPAYMAALTAMRRELKS